MARSDSGIFALKNKIQKMDVSCEDLVKQHLLRIYDTNYLNAFITVTDAQAVQQAAALDRRIRNGQTVGALAGIPIAVKDNIAVAGIENTCASNMLKGYPAQRNAYVVDKLYAADALIVGKNNMDELAMGVANRFSAYGQALNPQNIAYVPGGSSGGSACSVAAGQCAAALGSDTGGSIRQPAAYCGVVGFKPTYGTVRADGVMPMAPSLDQVGTLTRTVEDTALVYSVIAERAKLGLAAEQIFAAKERCDPAAFAQNLKGKTIAIIDEFDLQSLSGELQGFIQDALDRLTDLGAAVYRRSLPLFRKGLQAYSVISCYEADRCYRCLDGVCYGRGHGSSEGPDAKKRARSAGFGEEVKRRLMLGCYVSEHKQYLQQAAALRQEIGRQTDAVFETCDFVLSPTSLTTAFKVSERAEENPLIALSDMYTVIANLTGRPAISVPCGCNAQGLPYGLHLMGNPLEEADLFWAAAGYESGFTGRDH